MEVGTINRKIILEKNGQQITLDDIDPKAPISRVLRFHSGEHPELTNAKILGPTEEGEELVYNIKTNFDTLG